MTREMERGEMEKWRGETRRKGEKEIFEIN
jgi:hypothetical protein